MLKKSIIKRETINKLNLFLIGFFCQVNPLMSRKIMVIYIGFCLFLFLLTPKNKNIIKVTVAMKWYGVFLIYVLFSLFYTVNKINPDYVYIRMITYFILIFIISQRIENTKDFIWLIKGIILGGLLGIVKVLIVQSAYIGIKRIGWGENAGLFGSYAEFGNICMYSACSLISLFKIEKINKKTKILRIFILIFIFIAIFLSGARKAIIMPIMLMILMEIFDPKKKVGKRMLSLFLISLSLLTMVYLSLSNEYLYNTIGYRIESGLNEITGEQESDGSLMERERYAELAIELFKERPFFGYGIHGYAYKNFNVHHKLVYSHNGFLEILSCYGIVGFALFYWIFIKILIMYKILINQKDNVGLYLYALTIIILMLEPFSISYLSPFIIIMVCCCGDYLNKIKRKEININE